MGDIPIPPPKIPIEFEGRKIGEKNKEKERKTEKVVEFSIGGKHIWAKAISFQGGNPPYPLIFWPCPPQIFWASPPLEI